MANKVGRALIARMHAEVHEIGIHAGGKTDHELHTESEAAGRLEGELTAGKAAVKKVTGETPDLVRPPERTFNKAVEATYANVGLANLLWDIDGDQGKNLSRGELTKRIEAGVATVSAGGWKSTTPSSTLVVLLQDIQRGTATHLAAIADQIKRRLLSDVLFSRPEGSIRTPGGRSTSVRRGGPAAARSPTQATVRLRSVQPSCSRTMRLDQTRPRAGHWCATRPCTSTNKLAPQSFRRYPRVAGRDPKPRRTASRPRAARLPCTRLPSCCTSSVRRPWCVSQRPGLCAGWRAEARTSRRTS